MRKTPTLKNRQGLARSADPKQELVIENARLRRICERNKDLAARYEMLLREGDHRIKNSLQVVASLLGLQGRRETSPVARDALHAAALRIRAVARIHDALQLSGSKDVVNLGALIATMCQDLHAMAGDPRSIKIVVDAEPIEAPLAVAQPIVLAINELVINALRHAFPDNRHGAVLITLKQDRGQLIIVVADDGVGLPADRPEGLGYGMTLVRAMINKVGGVLDTQNHAGARFVLCVPDRMGTLAVKCITQPCEAMGA